jgi:putative DNA primase/helicase
MTPEKQALLDRLNFSVPEELRQLKAWLLWEKVQRAGKTKFDKVPYYVSGMKRFGKQGSPEDRVKLVTFNEAVAVLQRSEFDGIGLAMLGEGFVGLDFDGCVDDSGNIKPQVLALVEGTYAEKSPSGHGLRAFFAGELPDRKNLAAGIETFCRQGFLTITGARINGCEIARLSDPLRAQLIDLVGTAQGQTRSDRMRGAKAQDPVLKRLYELGMVKRDCGGGKFAIRCPFEAQHTTGGGPGDTVYFLPHTNGFAQAHFDCKHTHCASRPDDEFRRAIGLGEAAHEDAEDAPKRLVVDRAQPYAAALRLVAMDYTAESHRTLHYWQGDFYRFAGACYRPVPAADMRAQLYATLAKRGETPKGGAVKVNKTLVDQFEDALRAAAKLADRITAPAFLDGEKGTPGQFIACRNGLLHVGTRTLRPASPAYFVHNALEFDYDPHAPQPAEWFRFLESIWPDDFQQWDTLAEWFGYLLTLGTGQQKILMLVGPKRSGKGTIGRVLTALVGAANTCAPTLANLGTHFGLQGLIGKQLAIVSDARLGVKTDAAAVAENLLRISGEDNISVPRKFQPDFTGRLPVRFVLMSNELPALADASGALASRFIILSLTESFYGREDHLLFDRLRSELPGILNWSLDGLERLRECGHFEQPNAGAHLVQQLDALASAIKTFLADCCVLEPTRWIAVQSLFEEWCKWCRTQNICSAGTCQTFGKDLVAAAPHVRVRRPRADDGERERIYQGIGLNEFRPRY